MTGGVSRGTRWRRSRCSSRACRRRVGCPRWRRRAEAAGWDGISLTDSQNLIGDPVHRHGAGGAGDRAAAVHDRRDQPGHPPPRGAGHDRRPRCRRSPAVGSSSASAAATPRCSTSAASRCRSPTSSRRIEQLHTYLNGGTVDSDGRPSRLRWLDRATQPPVPIDIAAVGPEGDRVRGPHGRAHHVRRRRRPRAGGVGDRPGPHRDARRRSVRRRRVLRGLRQRRLPSRSGRRVRADPRRPRRVRPLLGHARVDRCRPGRARPRARGRGRPALRQQPAPGEPADHSSVLDDEFVVALRHRGRSRGVPGPAAGAGRPRARALRHHRRHLRRRPEPRRSTASGRADPRRDCCPPVRSLWDAARRRRGAPQRARRGRGPRGRCSSTASAGAGATGSPSSTRSRTASAAW